MSDEPNLNDERTTAMGLARYAFEYIEAALIVDDRMGQRKEFQVVAPIPALYLAGHGIELSLKLTFAIMMNLFVSSRNWGTT